MAYWSKVRAGANQFNQSPSEQWFVDAEAAGISWVRLTFANWESNSRDFLLGDADAYSGLIAEDLQRLVTVLDWAQRYRLKVVITPLSLPGARYRQLNQNERDLRLWRNKDYWEMAGVYWEDLAKALRTHPAVVAYHILNEPAPELVGDVAEHGGQDHEAQLAAWYARHKGTAADLFLFYQEMIRAIRRVDADTPIMVSPGLFAQPVAFTYWPEPLKDPKVLYAVHMYEPYAFTSGENYRKKRNLVYPGEIPFSGETKNWDGARVAGYMQSFFDWARHQNIPAHRLVLSEFGCMRRNKGCADYLEDVLKVIDSHQAHWAFYAFREDKWDGYDYELGTGGFGQAYWQAIAEGKEVKSPRRNTELFEPIRKRLEKSEFDNSH